MSHYVVIFAGGSATRLWAGHPGASPKQFQGLVYDRPLLVETVARLSAVAPPERILIVTSAEHEQLSADLLPILPRANVIGEPSARNTTAAIGLGAARVARLDPEAVVGFFPADHYVGEPERLVAAIRHGFALAESRGTVLIGVQPTEPSTGYGYIELGAPLGERDELAAFAVARFVEKPDRAHAEQFVASGNFLWNAGMFIWRVDRLRALFDINLPGAWSALERVEAALGRGRKDAAAYAEVPSLQVDYAIAEKAEDLAVVSASCGWRDLGDWAALLEVLPQDAAGNAAAAEHLLLDTRDTLIRATPGKLVATIGLEGLIVVETEDALFICPRDRAQEVRRIVQALRDRGREDLL